MEFLGQFVVLKTGYEAEIFPFLILLLHESAE
jgi:hypothetical protein